MADPTKPSPAVSGGDATDGRAPSPDLWGQLRRLDHTCHISLHGLYIDDARHWELIIRRKGDNSGDVVRVRRQSVVEAMAEGLRLAEEKGWTE